MTKRPRTVRKPRVVQENDPESLAKVRAWAGLPPLKKLTRFCLLCDKPFESIAFWLCDCCRRTT